MKILRLASISLVSLGLLARPAAALDILDGIADFTKDTVRGLNAGSDGPPPFRVGLMLPRDGRFSGPAERMSRGWKVAVSLADGIVAGRPIDIVDGETGNDPETAVKAAADMLRSRPVDVFAGILGARVARAMMLFAEKTDRPVIIGGAVGERVMTGSCNTRAARTSFNVGPYLTASGRFLAGKYRTAVTLAPDAPGGHRIIGRFVDAYRAAGGKLLQQIWAPTGRKFNWRSWLTGAAMPGPELIYAAFDGRNSERQVYDYSSTGLKRRLALTGPEWFYGPRTLNWRGNRAAGMRFLTSYYPGDDTPANRLFVDAYLSAYDEDPDSYAYLGYENAMAVLLTEAALKGRATDATSFVSTMTGLDYTGLMPRGRFVFDKANSAMLTHLHWVEVRHEDGKTWLSQLATVPVDADHEACTIAQARR